ncbi:MAG: ribosome biogenesis GTPase Der [Candidatus Gracilibacteria bacterium]|nr:ribosome biogenesis GTPase Der [Candidatus Gracilibacteria bacterium]
MIGRVTIVGRPNVGKSSLFNFLCGYRIAIVSDIENTTRDILDYQVNDQENAISYVLADSGGLNSGTKDEILKDVRKRAENSIDKSDIILFVLECDRISDLDLEIAKVLRKSGKEIIVIGNKADSQTRINDAYELYSLGFENVLFTSVAQNKGIFELKDIIAKTLKSKGLEIIEENYDDKFVKVAIIGRPNVGKSSIINAITGENRVMVKDMPGTTRDAVDTVFEWHDQKFVLIDTAGIRRAGKIGYKDIEEWSVMRSERSIVRADVVALVIDGFDGITAGDLHIVSKALEESKGIILVVNKWDKVLAKPGIDKESIKAEYMNYLKKKFDFLPFASPLFTSAIDGKRVDEILSEASKIKEERGKRVKTGVFNNFIEQVTYKHAPTGNKKSHKPKIYYGSQVDVNPPKFLISVNNQAHFHFSYKRYLENQIREYFGFWGTPIIVELKGRESIYKRDKSKPKNDKVRVY